MNTSSHRQDVFLVAKLLLVSFLLLSTTKTLYAQTPAAPAEWSAYDFNLEFVDAEARVIVVVDTELSVPYNTPIYGTSGRDLHIERLQTNKKIRVYLNSSKLQDPKTKVKRIDILN